MGRRLAFGAVAFLYDQTSRLLTRKVDNAKTKCFSSEGTGASNKAKAKAPMTTTWMM